MDYHAEIPTTPESREHSRVRLLAALLDTHHVTFYTVISVIQATCFGFLVLVCFEEGKHFTPSQWLLAANTLIILVLVWNGFIRGFVILLYVPKLADGMMPFALIILLYFVDRSHVETLFGYSLGRWAVGAVVIMVIMAQLWIRKLLAIDV